MIAQLSTRMKEAAKIKQGLMQKKVDSSSSLTLKVLEKKRKSYNELEVPNKYRIMAYKDTDTQS
jgi:hypothetical protein